MDIITTVNPGRVNKQPFANMFAIISFGDDYMSIIQV